MNETINLVELSRQLAEKAGASGSSGRAAQSVTHGNRLRQVLMAIRGGAALADHESPGEAMIHCLSGRVTMADGHESWELGAGDTVAIPSRIHRVDAHEDSVILLSVALKP